MGDPSFYDTAQTKKKSFITLALEIGTYLAEEYFWLLRDKSNKTFFGGKLH
jgi:hypothetical protein